MDPAPAAAARARRGDGPLAALTGALWPTSCAGCGALDERLCRRCARPLRERGGRAALAGTTAPGAPPTWAATSYEGPVRAAVVAWKDGGRADLDRWFAPALAGAVLAALEQGEHLRGGVGVGVGVGGVGGVGGGGGGGGGGPGATPLLLVPVPSRRAAVRARGRDVVGDLARRAAADLRRRGAPVLAAGLLRPGRTPLDQVGLDAAARAGNVARSLRAAGGAGAAQRCVVLVDDVVTTGATLAEAARVLRAAGAVVLAGAAVAATPRRDPAGPEEAGRDVTGPRPLRDRSVPGP